MKLRLSPAALIPLALALFALAPSRVEAGVNFGSYPAYCTKNSDGSGTCGGTLAAFRNSADANAYVLFQGGSAGSAQAGVFYVSLNGLYASCTTSAPLLVERMVSLTSHTGPFYISWDANGVCSQVVSYAISYYPQ